MIRIDGDWTSLIEASEAAEPDEEIWAAEVVKRARPMFPGALDIVMGVIAHEGTAASVETRLSVTSKNKPYRNIFSIGRGMLQGLPPPVFRRFFRPEQMVTSHVEVERTLRPDETEFPRALRGAVGAGDIVGILAQPMPNLMVAVSVLLPAAAKFDRTNRAILTRTALHLESSYRLRHRPELVKAVLDLDGRVTHRESDAPSNDVLTAHARARGTLDLWPALVDGRLSLVPRGKGRGRKLYLVENTPETQSFRALSSDEVSVLRHASRGLPTKLIAYGMGVSPSRVSTALANAAAKLGAATRTELVRVAAVLTRDLSADVDDARLTEAERDVLDLLRQGLTNEEIANLRLRSVRTIANQVASLLRKTGQASRRALAAR